MYRYTQKYKRADYRELFWLWTFDESATGKEIIQKKRNMTKSTKNYVIFIYSAMIVCLSIASFGYVNIFLCLFIPQPVLFNIFGGIYLGKFHSAVIAWHWKWAVDFWSLQQISCFILWIFLKFAGNIAISEVGYQFLWIVKLPSSIIEQ